MTKLVILHLDDDDFSRVEKIKSKVSSISTPQGAVKWALKQCAMQWGETEFVAEEPVTFHIVEEGEVFPKHQQGIPESRLPIIKLPPGNHLLEVPMSRLADFEGSVVMATDTLDLLRGKM
jgi:hypothetical protein